MTAECCRLFEIVPSWAQTVLLLSSLSIWIGIVVGKCIYLHDGSYQCKADSKNGSVQPLDTVIMWEEKKHEQTEWDRIKLPCPRFSVTFEWHFVIERSYSRIEFYNWICQCTTEEHSYWTCAAHIQETRNNCIDYFRKSKRIVDALWNWVRVFAVTSKTKRGNKMTTHEFRQLKMPTIWCVFMLMLIY